jgi:hypothetical protein
MRVIHSLRENEDTLSTSGIYAAESNLKALVLHIFKVLFCRIRVVQSPHR